ncbi:MAG: hypothetical protein LUD68_06290 [Rikenellaceae bacterium]|nr:hypothetical protein [Rikenellaceae bacterium]
MKKIVLSFLLFSLSWLLPGQSGSRMVHYSIEDGLPHNRISSIYQDSRGFIWLATLNGAVLFDGYEFTPYLNGSSEDYRVRNSRIVQITEDQSGRLWFVTYADEVHRLDPETDRLFNVGELIR